MPSTTDSSPDVPIASGARKLAAILAADMVGYSGWVETDEAKALAALALLRDRIYAIAQAHGGRVFSTAGDGFMLEFATASEAFDAAQALASGDGPAVRIGAHLGEVTPTAAGDLLGHGVNVAARIQSRAAPDAPLFSADLRRLLRGERATRLKSKGFLTLDKMEERIEVFGLADAPRRRRRALRRPTLAVAAALVLVGLVAGGLLLLRSLAAPPHASRLAVLPLSASGGAQAEALARSLRAGIQGQLLASDIDLVAPASLDDLAPSVAASRAQALGAGLLLAGSVTANREATHVGVSLSLAKAPLLLWSLDMDGLGDTASLEPQVLVKVADAIHCAVQADVAGLKPEILKTHMAACSRLDLLDRPELARTRDLYRKLTLDAPRFSGGFSGLAYVDGQMITRGLPPSEADTLRAEARTAAGRALALNGNDGVAYQALENIAARRDWSGRERLLRRGLAAAPEAAGLHASMGDFLNETGRSAEALVELERAYALDPNRASVTSALAYSWTGSGRERMAEALNAQTARQQPQYPGTWRVSLRTLVWAHRIGEARAVAARLTASAPRVQAPEVSDWQVLTAAIPVDGSAPTSEGLRAIEQVALFSRTDIGTDAVTELARWDVDAAFAAARRRFVGTDTRVMSLFNPPAKVMWKDRRFMVLARDLGLIAYWRAAGVWPDFCREPGLGYDCKTEAARVLPGA